MQYYQDVSSSHVDLYITSISNENSSKLFCKYRQTDSKVYMERQEVQKVNIIIKYKQIQRTDTIQLEDLQ